MVKTRCVRGPTPARFAMVLVWQSCGKPSTKFPHGGLVEFPYILYAFYLFLYKIRNLWIFQNFLETSHFSEFPQSLEYHRSGRGITFLRFYQIHIDLQHTLKRFSVHFSQGHPSKHWQLEKNCQCCIIFRGPQSGELSYCFRMSSRR